MFAMFKQFFTMFATLFAAGERGASALNHLAVALDDTAAAYADEQRIERAKKLALLNAELKAVEKSSNKLANAA